MLEGKEEKKKELEVQEDKGGLLPILGPLSRQRKSVMTEFLHPSVAIGFPVLRPGSRPCARHNLGAFNRHALATEPPNSMS